MQTPIEGIQYEAQLFERDRSEQRFIPLFAQNDGSVALAHFELHQAFSDVPFNLRSVGEDELSHSFRLEFQALPNRRAHDALCD